MKNIFLLFLGLKHWEVKIKFFINHAQEKILFNLKREKERLKQGNEKFSNRKWQAKVFRWYCTDTVGLKVKV